MKESNAGATLAATGKVERRTGKKARYSGSKKRELRDLKRKEEAETEAAIPEPSKKRKRSQSRSRSQSKTSERDKLDRLLRCAEECLFTDSIVVENRDEFEAEGSSNDNHNDTENVNENDNNNDNAPPPSNTLVVRIVTGGDRRESDGDSSAEPLPPVPALPPLSAPGHRVFTRRTTIFVRPLLVLDLNGILCHRDRTRRRPDGFASGDLRPSVGTVAQTPVVPRSDLRRFLRYLDEHFCLAVWTSARPKTAQCLLNALLGGRNDDFDGAAIRSRFLFVWNQKHCNAVRSADRKQPEGGSGGDGDGDDAGGVANNKTNDNQHNSNSNHGFDDTIYEKHLPKIWRSYPLWSANNTLLMDDSPEKVPRAVSNAVHPPPLDGRLVGSGDASNEALQRTFFEALAGFWRNREHASAPWKATAGGTLREDRARAAELTHREYREFLETHAKGHMGWRAPPD